MDRLRIKQYHLLFETWGIYQLLRKAIIRHRQKNYHTCAWCGMFWTV